MRAKQCDVTIFKSIEVTIAKQIYEHEIKILEQIFGDGNVKKYTKHEYHYPKDKKYQVQNKDPVVHKVQEIEYESEYSRLQTAYGIIEGTELMSNVEYVYGRMEDRRLEKENNEKYAGQYITPDAFDEEEDDVIDMNYNEMTNRQLKDLLDEMGIKYKPISKKEVLVDLIEKADKGELETVS